MTHWELVPNISELTCTVRPTLPAMGNEMLKSGEPENHNNTTLGAFSPADLEKNPKYKTKGDLKNERKWFNRQALDRTR